MKKTLFAAGLLAASLVACRRDDDQPPTPLPMEQLVTGPDQVLFGLTANNSLVRFNARTPGTSLASVTINGLGAGEKLMSIDFRPATGELYALSSASRLYVINTGSGAARAIGSAAFTPALSGTIGSIDFNPTVDRIRLVSNTGQNLRLHPETGGNAATDAALNGPASPAVTAVGYTNSRAGAGTTVLYDIDAAAGKLYRQDPPNNGTLVEVGALGVTSTAQAGFDITPANVALATIGGSLYTIDLATGKAGRIGTTTEALIDIAVPTEAVAYGVDEANNLVIFNPSNVAAGVVNKPITGLQASEQVLGIDFRPVNGQLYALGSSSRLYTINLANGAATQVGTGTFATMLMGTDFGFDFNPTVDRIRVVSNTGQNLRLNPIDGTVAAADGALNPGTPAVSSAAYTNNFAGATTTQLFVIDHVTDRIYLQNPPNNGTLVDVGALGINVGANNGFDIGGTSGNAFLVATVGSATSLYSVNLMTGASATPVAFPVAVRGMAVAPGF